MKRFKRNQWNRVLVLLTAMLFILAGFAAASGVEEEPAAGGAPKVDFPTRPV